MNLDHSKNISKGKEEFRENVLDFEKEFSKRPGVKFGDSDLCPIRHVFAGEFYVREMFCPKDTMVVTKIHKLDHPYFVLTGEVSVLTEQGFTRLKAPFSGITKAGTKRVCYTHEDTIWTTVHNVGDERDLEKIEEFVIAKTFDEVTESKFDYKLFRELTKKVIKAEKYGFWSDWTEEQQKTYASGDWEAFSRLRGYTDQEIEDFKEWLTLYHEGNESGAKPLEYVNDLVIKASIENLKKDTNGEIAKSSHIPILSIKNKVGA